jgi:ribosome recycling factor
MSEVSTKAEERMKKTLAALNETFAGLRTGRAHASLLDKIRVDAYGQKSPIKEMANISTPEARLIVIQPWDKALITEIEKAIRTSDLSLNPSNDGKVIRIQIPPLTGDRRKELVKQAKAEAEKSRVSIRNIRRDGNEELKKAKKDSKITEDEQKKSEEELQKLTDAYIGKIDKTAADKEKEIMEV